MPAFVRLWHSKAGYVIAERTTVSLYDMRFVVDVQQQKMHWRKPHLKARVVRLCGKVLPVDKIQKKVRVFATDTWKDLRQKLCNLVVPPILTQPELEAFKLSVANDS